MSTQDRTSKASIQRANLASMNEINTSQHIKVLEGEEYLAMKHKMMVGHSCKTCTFFRQRRYHTECSLMGKTIRHYNICTAHKDAIAAIREEAYRINAEIDAMFSPSKVGGSK